MLHHTDMVKELHAHPGELCPNTEADPKAG